MKTLKFGKGLENIMFVIRQINVNGRDRRGGILEALVNLILNTVKFRAMVNSPRGRKR